MNCQESRFNSVVVITLASHARGPGFEPQLNLAYVLLSFYCNSVHQGISLPRPPPPFFFFFILYDLLYDLDALPLNLYTVSLELIIPLVASVFTYITLVVLRGCYQNMISETISIYIIHNMCVLLPIDWNIKWIKEHGVVVAEWLRRWTRNPLGSSRAGSNPADNEIFCFFAIENTRPMVKNTLKNMKFKTNEIIEF